MFVRAGVKMERCRVMAIPNPARPDLLSTGSRLPISRSRVHLGLPRYISEHRNLIGASPVPLHLYSSINERILKKEGRDPAGRSSHRYRYPPVYIHTVYTLGGSIHGSVQQQINERAKMKRKSCIQHNLFFLDNVSWNEPMLRATRHWIE